MKQKKIVIKTDTFPTLSETFIVSNIVTAICKGFDVKIIARHKLELTSQEGLSRQFHLPSKTAYFIQPKEKFERYLKTIFYFLNPALFFYFIKYCFYKRKISLEYLFSLQFYKKYRKYDLFHIHFATASDNIPILKKIGFIESKVMVTFHGFDAYFQNEDQLKISRERYKVMFDIANKITVNTFYLQDKVLALGCPMHKMKIVPVGIDFNFYLPNNFPKQIPKKSIVKLISVGRLVKLKGHEHGIRAIKILVDNGYNVLYTIIGDGILYDSLQNLIINLKLENYVNLIGSASQEKIKHELDNSHFFLMLSVKDEDGREEAQGIVTAEAQSMGLPVIGFESGGIPFTISESTGILVAQKDIVSLVNNIEKLIKDNEKYMQMSNDARIWAIENFDISKMISNYYSDII